MFDILGSKLTPIECARIMIKWKSSDILPQQKDRYIQADFLAFIDLGNGHEYQKVLVFNFDNKTWK